MELLKKYPKLFQWLFLLMYFFPYVLQLMFQKHINLLEVKQNLLKIQIKVVHLFGKEVRYYAFDVFWRFPPLLGWLPIWINDSLFFLMNEWMPMEFWNEDTQSYQNSTFSSSINKKYNSIYDIS